VRRLLAVGLLALAAAAPVAASEEHPTPAELESELVCPVCETTLDTSNAPIALRMKEKIRERIAAGATKTEIKDEFVEQFGPGVLAVPPKRGFDLLAWLLPLAGVALAAVVVALLAWRWSRRRVDEAAAPLDPELERRLDAELARFE
jgi:cytochrome c-type biogenesis protein CcmH